MTFCTWTRVLPLYCRAASVSGIGAMLLVLHHLLASLYIARRQATHCNTLQHITTHCNMMQHATHCNTLQHTATQYNTLQHATNPRVSSAYYARLITHIHARTQKRELTRGSLHSRAHSHAYTHTRTHTRMHKRTDTHTNTHTHTS